VIVTSRGRPIVRLLPVAPEAIKKEPSAAEINRRLAALPGVILLTGPKPRGSKHPIRIRKGEKTLAEIVLEDRRCPFTSTLQQWWNCTLSNSVTQ
jgi:antitoxin (DNA-binding transcriptional repressor) of toxin-antitoxin stability system